MENKFKIGFYKSCPGVMPTAAQHVCLINICDVVHVDLDAALSDMTRGNEILVVVSPAVLGSKIPEIMGLLCGKNATLYSTISEKEYNPCLTIDVVAARNELSERKSAYLSNRTGKAKGGRPPSLTPTQKQEIRDLVDTGMTRDKIMSRYDRSAATISRVLKVKEV